MGIINALFDVEVEQRATLSDVDNFLDFLASGPTSASGVTVTESTALKHGVVFACIKVLAEDIASLPLHIYKRLKGGGKERAINHPLYNIFRDLPNPEMTSFEYRQTQMVHLLAWGNHYSFIDKNQIGRVKGLWPLLPNKMTVKREKGKLVYLHEKTLDTGEVVQIQYRPDEIWHIRGMGGNGIIGYSPIRQCAETIGLSMATQEFGARFFSNDARPGIVLKHPGKLQDDVHKRLIKSWQRAYSGLANKHKAALLEENMDIKEIGIPPQDAQFLETRKLQRSEIAGIYRMKLHKIADLDKATFSNLDHLGIEYVVDCIRPWCVNVEQSIKKQFLGPREGLNYFAEHLIDSLLRGDSVTRNQAYATARQWGWMSANDVREKENMNPIDGGNVYLIPMNMIPADGSYKKAGPIAPPEEEEPEELEDKIRGLREFRSVANRAKARKTYHRLFKDAGERLVRKEILTIKRIIQKTLKKPKDLNKFLALVNEFYSGFGEDIRKMLGPILMSYAEEIQTSALAEFEAEVKAESRASVYCTCEEKPVSLETLMEHYEKTCIESHLARSNNVINNLAVTEVIEELPDRLTVILDQWDLTRPDQIAIREIVKTDGFVARATFFGVGAGKVKWVLSEGEKSPFCRALHGKTTTINETFLKQGTTFNPKGASSPLKIHKNFYHPPLYSGCSCSIVLG